jgi:hypothetical protein
MSIKVLDNVFDKKYLTSLQNFICNNNNFPWYLVNNISDEKNKDGYYFVHEFYKNDSINSNLFEIIAPFLEKIKRKSLIRAKANLYPSSEKLIEHGTHIDFTYKHNTLLFYLNTNNGFTRFGDKKISSVENKAVVFDGSTPHNSTNCTDKNYRITINFNYF